MKLSVLMITYNHEMYIAQALDSALAQRVSFDYEIVVGEDNSSDGTSRILHEYRDRFPDKIRIINSGSNVGIHENFIRTYRACQGDYIAVLEGDDFWNSPDKLQQQVDFLDNNPDCVICFHAVDIFSQASGKVIETVRAAAADTSFTVDDILRDNIILTCSAVFKNRLITEFPQWLFGLKMMDWPIHIMNAQHGSLMYLNKVMATYRVHSTGVWSQDTVETRLQSVIDTFQVFIQNFDDSFTERLFQAQTAYRLKLLNEYLNYGNAEAAGALLSVLQEADPALRLPLAAVSWKLKYSWLFRILGRFYDSVPAVKRVVKVVKRAAASS